MIKKVLWIAILLAGCLLSCNAQTPSFRSVEAGVFESFISDSTVICVDVRRAAEYADGHIKGAINIDVLSPDFKEKALSQLPANSSLAVYCRSGKRSKKAASILSSMGYTVVELNQGVLGWVAVGKDLVK